MRIHLNPTSQIHLPIFMRQGVQAIAKAKKSNPLAHHVAKYASKGCGRGYGTTVRNTRPFRMAVLGAGPAGFYTAYKVMSSIDNAVIDMYEYLPVPFGLVRFGVAPDHPEVKVRNMIIYFSMLSSQTFL